MRHGVFFRRILALLLIALVLWTGMTILLYGLFTRVLFTRLKIDEFKNKGQALAQMRVDRSSLSYLFSHSKQLFDAWLFHADGGLSDQIISSDLPADFSAAARQELRGVLLNMRNQLAGSDSDYQAVEMRLTNHRDVLLIVGIPNRSPPPIQSLTSVLFFVRPMNEIEAGTRGINLALLYSALAVLLVMILPAYFAARHLLQPLRQTRDVALAMSSGDFSTRADASKPGEIGELAGAINLLSDRLSSTIAALEQERDRLRQVFISMSDGLLAVDAAGQIIQANPALQTMLGLEQEPAGTVLDILSAPGERSLIELISLLQSSRASGSPQELQIRRGERILRAQATPILDVNNNNAGAMLLLRDVTEAELLEQTRRDYVANVSHELRSPLTAMRALVEPLRDGLVVHKSDRQRYYDILLRENIRLSHLIDDMLELSRLQTGGLRFEAEQLDLAPLLHDLWLRYQPQASERNITLTFPPAGAVLPYVWADAERVDQILVILLDNALKYTPSEGHIDVSVLPVGRLVEITVSDTGCGISEADQEHVFDRFFKADKAHQQTGTGLGLSIARELLRLMQQKIFVRSVPGQGSAFTFTLSQDPTEPEDDIKKTRG